MPWRVCVAARRGTCGASGRAEADLTALITNATVVTMDAAGRTIAEGAVAIDGRVTRGDDVETTIVNGRVLMRDRKMLTLDERTVLADAGKQAGLVRAAVGK